MIDFNGVNVITEDSDGNILNIDCGIADVQICDSENVKSEINKHDRPKKEDIIDLVHGFWRNCYKIKNTNFNIDITN